MAADRRPRALVTGASRGIGAAVARRLVTDGYTVTVSARDREALQQTVAGWEVPGTAYVSVEPADLGRPEDVDRLAAAQSALDPALDVLVLCAGVGTAGPVHAYPVARAQRQLEVNFLSAFRLVQGLLPALRRAARMSSAGTAKIVAIASITGVASEPGLSAYGASKAALISLCESITVDEAGTGVTASAISPGYVDTDMSSWIKDRIPAAEMIAVEDVAELVLALCRLSRHAVVPNVVLTRPGRELWRA